MRNRSGQKRTSRISIAISAVLHAAAIAALFFFAAREGMLGKELKKIAVTMVPKEPPPEKPKEKPPEPKPSLPEEKPEVVTPLQAAPSPAKLAAPPPDIATAAPLAAPPAAALPAFEFEGGKPVETTTDPNRLYKSYVEYTLRSNWDRPDGIEDQNYSAEVELRIDPQGRILETRWQKGSGDGVWDASVRAALAKTHSLGRSPPRRFPERVVVRFDVQTTNEALLE